MTTEQGLGRGETYSKSPTRPVESDMRPPSPRLGFIVRRALVDGLRTSDADVFTLTAPRGYGKTTTLAQWAREETGALAWLTLRREDNNARTLLHRLAVSMRNARLVSDEDVAFYELLGDEEDPVDAARHFPSLLSTGDPFVIAIDNADVLRSRATIDVISELVRQFEGVARVALASNSTLKIGLPALRAGGRLMEITEDDLKFSVADIEQLVAGLEVHPRIAADIFDYTQGWPAAVFLLAQGARRGKLDSPDRRIETQRHLNEFVRSEIVAHLSQRRRRFLSLVSPLERISGALSDAITGNAGSQRVLESLESDTHLIHHLDHDNRWFTMNRVLRDYLRGDLAQRDPEQVRVVHSRAATWYEANGMLLEAAGHAREAGDIESFARMAERLVKSRYVSGHLGEVLTWMDLLERDLSLGEFPRLAAIGALVHIQEGNLLKTEKWLDAASQGDTDDEVKALVALVRASRTGSGVEQMHHDIEIALQAAGPGSRWLPAILVIKGLAHLMNADTNLAEACFVEAAKIGQENDSRATGILALGQRALIAIERRDWDLAESLSDEALAIIDEFAFDGYLVSVLPLVAASRCARRNNDISGARRLLARASSARRRLSAAMPGLSVQILIEIARAHVVLSDVDVARSFIRQAEAIIRQRPDLGVLPSEVEEAKESMANIGSGKARLPTLTKAELRLLPYLATHMSFPEIGEELFVSRHTVKSQATSIYRKLGSSTRSEAIAKAYEIGLLTR